MTWFWEHGEELFILFAFPLIGLMLDLWVTSKAIRYILIASLVLFIPMLFGYEYVVSWVYPLCGLIALSCFYTFYSRLMERKFPKIFSSILISGLLFVILSWFAFMDAFGGSQTVEKQWSKGGYKVEYIRDQGFAGRPLMKYQLTKIGFLPFLIRRMEVAAEYKIVYDCEIPFKEAGMLFNKCDTTLRSYP